MCLHNVTCTHLKHSIVCYCHCKRTVCLCKYVFTAQQSYHQYLVEKEKKKHLLAPVQCLCAVQKYFAEGNTKQKQNLMIQFCCVIQKHRINVYIFVILFFTFIISLFHVILENVLNLNVFISKLYTYKQWDTCIFLFLK